MNKKPCFLCHQYRKVFEAHLQGDKRPHEYCQECLTREEKRKGLLVTEPVPALIAAVSEPVPMVQEISVTRGEFETWVEKSPYIQFAGVAWYAFTMVDATRDFAQKLEALKVALDAIERGNAFRSDSDEVNPQDRSW